MTGDADKARELATAALVSSCRRWSAIRYHRPADAVLRELYGRFLGATGAPWPAPEGHLLAGLAPRTRAAVVVTFHDGLSLPHAAVITGLWIGALDDELRRARAQLRTTHPTLFENHPAPPGNPAAPAEDPADPAWGRQGDRPGSGAASASLWTLAPAPEPAAPTAAPQDGAPGDQALRAALLGLATGMPRTDLAETVLRRVTARRRIRVAVWTSASLGLVAAMVATIVAGLSAVADRVDETMARATSDPGTRGPGQEVRDPLPTALPDPVRFAYPGYCRDA
ncbi:hypothetical protein ACNF49_52510 [Actinomadura sp. ATCC 39365]